MKSRMKSSCVWKKYIAFNLRMKTSSGRKWDSETCVGETYMLHYRDHYTVQGDIIYYQMLRFF